MENIERPARRAGNRAFQPVERRPMGERQPVDERQMPQALPEVLIAGLFRVHQLRHGAAAAEIRHQPWPFPASPRSKRKVRSEEHTSELQSLMRISYDVFRLKKTTK